MKKIATYSLFVLLLFAFNYKTIDLCFMPADDITSCFTDLDCEESSTESEESDEKEKKTDILEYLSLNKPHDLTIHSYLSFAKTIKLFLFSSDYSIAVYSPPEQHLI